MHRNCSAEPRLTALTCPETCKDWTTHPTCRFCTYPQELLLALHAPAQLAQLQLLVHEAKIASRIELHAGLLPPGNTDMSRCERGRPKQPRAEQEVEEQSGRPVRSRPTTADRSCTWRRLGHTSLDSNERSGHGARELRSVRIDAAAGLLRLQLQRCHINALNPGNQVRFLSADVQAQPAATPVTCAPGWQ